MFLGYVSASNILQQARPRWSITLTDNSGYLLFLRFAERRLASTVLPLCYRSSSVCRWNFQCPKIFLKRVLKMQTVWIYIQIITTWHYNCRFASSALRVIWTWWVLHQCVCLTDISGEFYLLSCQKGKRSWDTFLFSVSDLCPRVKQKWVKFALLAIDPTSRKICEMMNELRRRQQLLNIQDFGSAGRRRGFVKLQRATIKIRKRMEELRLMFPWGCLQ